MTHENKNERVEREMDDPNPFVPVIYSSTALLLVALPP